MNKQKYTPQPIDTTDVKLPNELEELVEKMSKNVHDVWAETRIKQGWTYGEQRNDEQKTHPCLVSYEDLPEKEKEYGHEIFLISDEPYREIVFEGTDSPYITKYYDNSISCYSYSKSLSIPGERLGYVAVNPKAKDAEYIVPMCGQISRFTGHNCPPSIIMQAVAKVIDETSDLSVYETNANLLYEALTDMGYSCVKPGGTFYMFPKSPIEDANEFCWTAAKELGLIIVPGDSFECPGHFRISYCVQTETIEKAIPLFRKALELV